MNNQRSSGLWTIFFPAALALLLIIAAVSMARAEDWPNFLGPRFNGTSPETNLLEKWSATKGPLHLWSRKVGTGYSAPSVRGNLLVLHHRIGNEEIVEAMDASTGKSKWQHSYPSSYIDPYGYNNGPRCAPLLSSNYCYAFGAEGKLVCVELQNGKLVWERDTGKDWNIPPAFFGVGSTPFLDGDRLLVMVGGQTNSGAVALNAKTGKTLWENVGGSNWTGQPMHGWPGEAPLVWQSWFKQASYSSPIVATLGGKRAALFVMRQGLVSLNPENGEVNFSRFFQSIGNDSVNAMTPVVVDDYVFISAAYFRVGSVLLKVKPGGKEFDEIWKGTQLEIHWNTPIYHDGYLFAFTGRNEPDAHFRCVEFKTGKVMWDRDERWVPHSATQPPVYGRGSAIKADNKLITLGEGGLLGLFKLRPQKDEEICRYQVPELHYPCWAAPVLSNQRLYLRSEGALVCLDFKRQ